MMQFLLVVLVGGGLFICKYLSTKVFVWCLAITGIVVYAPSLALSAVTGLSFQGAVISIGQLQ